MNYFLKKHKVVAWVLMLTFLLSAVMPTNLVAGNSVAEAAKSDGDTVGGEKIIGDEGLTTISKSFSGLTVDQIPVDTFVMNVGQSVLTIDGKTIGDTVTEAAKYGPIASEDGKTLTYYWELPFMASPSYTEDGYAVENYNVTTTDSADSKGAALEVKIVDKGINPPQITQGNAIDISTGVNCVVFSLTSNGYRYFVWTKDELANTVKLALIDELNKDGFAKQEALYWRNLNDTNILFLSGYNENGIKTIDFRNGKLYVDWPNKKVWAGETNQVAHGGGYCIYAVTIPSAELAVTNTYTSTQATYTVEYYYEGANGYPTTADYTDSRTGTIGTTVEVTTTDKTPRAERLGYSLDSTKNTLWSGTVVADSSLVLKVYFKKNPYKVTYQYEGTVPQNAPAVPSEKTYSYGATVNVAPAASLEGYTFSGWATTDVTVSGGSFTMPTSDVVLKGSFTANPNTKYTVEYYYQVNGEYRQEATSSEIRTGTTDTTAIVTEADKTPTKDGYAFDASAGNVLEGNIAGDGSLVLKVYFGQNLAAYQIIYHYLDVNGQEEMEKTSSSSLKHLPAGSRISLSDDAKKPAYEGYVYEKAMHEGQPLVEPVTLTVEKPTVINVYFLSTAEKYRVVYNYVEAGKEPVAVIDTGYVVDYDKAFSAPSVTSKEWFDGSWYTTTELKNVWNFSESMKEAVEAGKVTLEGRTLNLYTSAKVVAPGTIRVQKAAVNGKEGTVYEFKIDFTATNTPQYMTPEDAAAINKAVSAQVKAQNAVDTAEENLNNATANVNNARTALMDTVLGISKDSQYSFIAYYDFGEEREDAQEGECFGKWAIWAVTTPSGLDMPVARMLGDAMFKLTNTYTVTTESMLKFVVDAADAVYAEDPTWGQEGFLSRMFDELNRKLVAPSTTGTALAFGMDEAVEYYQALKYQDDKADDLEAAETALEQANADLEQAKRDHGLSDAVVEISYTLNGEKTVMPVVVKDGKASETFGLKAGEFADFTVTTTSGSAVSFEVKEINNGGADSTTIQVNGASVAAATGTVTTGSAYNVLFTNIFKAPQPTPDPQPVPPTPTPDPDPVKPEPTPEEPIDDPEVPTGDAEDYTDVEIEEPEIPLGAPQTGDAANAAGMMAMLAMAAAGLVATRRKFN